MGRGRGTMKTKIQNGLRDVAFAARSRTSDTANIPPTGILSPGAIALLGCSDSSNRRAFELPSHPQRSSDKGGLDRSSQHLTEARHFAFE